MKAFARGKLAVIIRFTIIGLFIPFVLFRFLIGYRRMKKGYLQDFEIQTYHGYAFGVMAVADLICTFSILYFVRQNNLRAISNLNDYIKHSSYTILVGVDIVSTLLSVLSIINAITLNSSPILKSLTIPLYCFKSSFVLILAIDAFLFKYGANVTSINESRSSNNNSKNYVVNSNSTGYKSYKNLELNNKINNKSLNSSYSIDMTNINTNNSRNNVPQYKANLQALEKAKTDAPIVKNYTNLPTNQAAFLFDTNTKASSQMEVNAYSKTFGYHY
ncbi:hypothetical protein LY90DRAFT_697227 [Neocallimastix californiae]|uniref:Uncharacterized protein n=1 Tax=Neocallimastix californiae TaxID=1754190 RepID=A0A1Y2FJ34_9FUNG|nr:hypothetical protein LY90DRAFT_697227 [Neocallimastix californiae]|eukprot:ORY83982.1 hypothetical protein LY90DRAFT_697227 [Neocallimastix californiae]